MLQHCVSSSCGQGKWGRHTHGWSAPHGPSLCGLRPTSDSSGSQLGRALLTFSVPFYCNSLELQEEAGTVYRAISSSERLTVQLANLSLPTDVVKFFYEFVKHFYHQSDRQWFLVTITFIFLSTYACMLLFK